MAREGILNMQLIWYRLSSWASIAPDYHVVSSTDDFGEFVNECEIAADGLAFDCTAAMQTDASSQLVRFRTKAGDLGLDFLDEVNLHEGSWVPSFPLPMMTAVLMKKITSDGYQRGRVYYPYPLTQCFLEGDLIDTANDALLIVAAALKGTITVGGTVMTPVVHHSASGTWQPVLDVQIANYVSHRIKRGVNHFQGNP